MKVLLIGWDAANGSLMQSLLERGMAPRLERFLSAAVSLDVAAVRPFDPAPMWTSLATGQRAAAHSVLTPAEVDPTGERLRPASRWSLTARPVWSRLSAAGYRVQAYGWPASHPAEPLNGVAVSDQFAELGEAASVHPPALAETMNALRLAPADIDAASLVTLVPRAGELVLVGDQRLYTVAQFLASTASLHAAATWGLEHQPWDFAAVRYDGLARLARVFGPYSSAAEVGEPDEAAAIFGEVLPNACRFFDMLLGRLLDLAGPDADVALVAASYPPPAAAPPRACPEPWRLIAAGPTVGRSGGLTLQTICDVAPTILGWFGVEPAPAGKEPERYVEPPAPQPVDDESIAHLVELGYREQPDEYLRLAIRGLQQQRQRRLAEALLDSHDYAQAVPALRGLLAKDPQSSALRSTLAEAYFHTGQYGECRRLILELQSEETDTPLGRVALAGLDVLEASGDPVAQLRRAEALGGASPRLLELMGRLYLGLRRRADAARVLDAALALDSGLATAHVSRATAYLYSGDAPAAERHAREAAALEPRSSAAAYQLGLALAGQNRIDAAIAAFKVGLACDADNPAWVHGRLADLLEARGDHALAVHHRAMFDRGGRSRRRGSFDFDAFNQGWA